MSDDKTSIIADLRFGAHAYFLYTNYKGETEHRSATLDAMFYGATPWHPHPQWLVRAFDHDKQATRTFSLAGIDASSLRYGRPA